MATPTVSFEDITNGSPTGSGIFDKLMKSVKAHLKEEYDNQRIRGSEYTQVYLGSIQTAIGQAMQWQLGAQNAANQAQLIDAQIEQVNAQTNLTDEQKALVTEQILQTKQQVTNMIAENANIIKQGTLLDAQNTLTNANASLTSAKTLTEAEQLEVVKYNHENMLPSQKGLVDQKAKTEEAQIRSTVDGVAVTGAIGKRNDLLDKQADGFDRDAEQKAARAVMDMWGMAVGSGIDGDSFPTEISTARLDSLIQTLRTNASV